MGETRPHSRGSLPNRIAHIFCSPPFTPKRALSHILCFLAQPFLASYFGTTIDKCFIVQPALNSDRHLICEYLPSFRIRS